MDIQHEHFDCLCRTCMNEVEAGSDEVNAKSQQWLTIFDSIEDCGALRIDELLSNAVPQIEVHLRNEELPNKICSECLQQLLSVYRFQQMCVQSEEKLRQWASKKSIKSEIDTNEAVSYPSKIVPSTSTFQNLQQEPIQEKTEQIIKLEVSSAADHLQNIDRSMEHANDSQDNVIEFIKNEPIEDDEHSIKSIDGDSMRSIISVVKDEALSVESEGQEINVSNFKDERLTHSESKSYECSYCPLTFSSKKYAVKHKEIHEGRKRVSCDICGKSFRKSSLKPHKIIHSGEESYKCKFCERRFNHVQPLPDHVRSHTGEKSYKCKYCERAYGSNSSMAKHLRTHLDENIYRCEFCSLAFPSISELRLHFTTHKNEDPETRERNLEALREEGAKLKLLISKEKTPQPWSENSELPLHLTAHKNEDPETNAQNLKAWGEEEAKFNLQIPKGTSKQPSAEDSHQFERHANECKKKCFTHFSPDDKTFCISKINGFSTKDEQDLYLQQLIEKFEVIRRRPRKKDSTKRKSAFKYYVLNKDNKVNVCKKAFISLYGISEQRVRRLCLLLADGKTPKDMRGRQSNRVPPEFCQRHEHIRYPRKTVHYTGTDTENLDSGDCM